MLDTVMTMTIGRCLVFCCLSTFFCITSIAITTITCFVTVARSHEFSPESREAISGRRPHHWLDVVVDPFVRTGFGALGI